MSEHFTAHLRLTILRLLAGAPGYRANSSIMHSAAVEFGLGASRDQIKSELAWLSEQGAVQTTGVGGLVVATLTDRGLDVAEGRAVIPGVQRPAPGA
jgi:hypothetical protein